MARIIDVRGKPGGRLVALLISLGAFFIDGSSFACGQDVTLQSIRSKYAASLAPLRTVWTMSRLNRSMTPAAMKVDEFTGCPVEWAVDGKKWLFFLDFDGPKEGGSEKWVSYDGNRVWRKRFSRQRESGQPFSLEYRTLATATDSDVRSSHAVGTFLGIYLYAGKTNQTGLSLLDLLVRSDAKFAQEEVIDSALEGPVRCYRVDCRRPDVNHSRTWALTAWFDPARGYLPRSILREMDGGGGESWEATFAVEQFQRVPTSDGNQIWFPRVCTYRHPLGSEALHVDDVQIGSLPASVRFTPEVTSDVPAFNGDDFEDYQRMWDHWADGHGRQERLARIRKESEERRKRGPTRLAALPTPRLPAQPRGWLTREPVGLVFLGVGLMLMVSGSWIALRRG